VMRLAYTNLLWILFTILGLIILGWFPSTVGLFAVVRKLVRGEPDVPIFKTFWRTYRKEFVNGNILGFIFLLIGIVIYVDIQTFKSSEDTSSLLLYYFFILLFFLYYLTFMYLFVVFVHYDLKILQYIKQSFFIMISQPVSSIVMIV